MTDVPVLPTFEGADEVLGLGPIRIPASLYNGDGQAIVKLKVYRLVGNVYEVVVQSLIGVLTGEGADILATIQIKANSVNKAIRIADNWIRSLTSVVNKDIVGYGDSANLYVLSNR